MLFSSRKVLLPTGTATVLPFVLLLLTVLASVAECELSKEEADIALAMPNVLHQLADEKFNLFTELVGSVAMRLPNAIADYKKTYQQKQPINDDEKKKKEEKENFHHNHHEIVEQIRVTLNSNAMLREQLEKVFIAMKVKLTIEAVKKMAVPRPISAGHNPKSAETIKSYVYEIVKAELHVKPNDEAEAKKLKEIIGITVMQHEHELLGSVANEHSKKKLRIAQVAPNFTQTPPRSYGGTERIVSYLTEEFIKRGHEVTLFASADSITCGKLVFKWPALFMTPKLKEANQWIMDQVELHVNHGEFDIVHFHTDFQWEKVQHMAAETNVLATMHFLIKSKELAVLGTKYTNIPLVSISKDQRKHHPMLERGQTWNPYFLDTVYHGLPQTMYKFVSAEEQEKRLAMPGSKYGQKKYLSFLGRIAPPKRPDMAIRIAAEARIPLKMAASINAEDKLYWQDGIEPLINLVNAGGDKREIAQFQERIAIVVQHLEKNIEPNDEYKHKIAEFDKKNMKLMEKIAKHKREVASNTDKPLLVEYIGQVNDEQKNEFLGNSLAMLFPIYWNEPFGLVMIEAMAVGTPVITRKIGSVGEVIKPGVSGLIFAEHKDGVPMDKEKEEEEVREAAKAVHNVHKIDRQKVRAEFEAQFTVKKMVDGYEAVFEKLIKANGEKKKGDKKKHNVEEEGDFHGNQQVRAVHPEHQVGAVHGRQQVHEEEEN